MNLTYRILWIDDDENFVESQSQILENLKNYIEDEGFDLHLQFFTSPDQIEMDKIVNEFDLMVIDYNLTESGDNGDDVIKSIRDHKCLTEVIFYSAAAADKLRQFALDKKLDGVFFSTKDADVLLGKVLGVFDLTVRKVLDVDNMRGLVMAGVADIDHQLSDLLRTLHNQLDQDKQLAHRMKLFAKMMPPVNNIKKLVIDEKHNALQALEKAIEAVKELEAKDFETLIGSRGFDSNKRVAAIESFCKEDEALIPYKDKVEKIKELLKWRNALAHQRPSIDQSGIHFFSPNEGRPEAFDAKQRKDLRKALREHRVHLDEAHGMVKVP